MTQPWCFLVVFKQTLTLILINTQRVKLLLNSVGLALVMAVFVLLSLGGNTLANAQVSAADLANDSLNIQSTHQQHQQQATDCHQHPSDASPHGQQPDTTAHCCAFLCGGTAAIQLALPNDPRVLMADPLVTLPDYLSSASYYHMKPPQRPPRLIYI